MHCSTIQHLAKLGAIRSWKYKMLHWYAKVEISFDVLTTNLVISKTFVLSFSFSKKKYDYPKVNNWSLCYYKWTKVICDFTGEKLLKYCQCIILLLYLPLEKVAIIQLNNARPLYTMIIKLVKFLNVFCREQNVKVC